jgi:anti-sigma factor RsiW
VTRFTSTADPIVTEVVADHERSMMADHLTDVPTGNDRSGAAPKLESRNGFNIVRWRMGGLSYVAVSDAEGAQLLAFVRLVESG